MPASKGIRPATLKDRMFLLFIILQALSYILRTTKLKEGSTLAKNARKKTRAQYKKSSASSLGAASKFNRNFFQSLYIKVKRLTGWTIHFYPIRRFSRKSLILSLFLPSNIKNTQKHFSKSPYFVQKYIQKNSHFWNWLWHFRKFLGYFEFPIAV